MEVFNREFFKNKVYAERVTNTTTNLNGESKKITNEEYSNFNK